MSESDYGWATRLENWGFRGVVEVRYLKCLPNTITYLPVANMGYVSPDLRMLGISNDDRGSLIIPTADLKIFVTAPFPEYEFVSNGHIVRYKETSNTIHYWIDGKEIHSGKR